MKETVAAFERRSGLSYDPPAWLRALGRPLGPREAVPTLFRYPGPEGLRDALGGMLRRLAPRERGWVWLSAGAMKAHAPAARHFGAVAVLEPLRLQPCRAAQRGVWLGLNRRLDAEPWLLWVPPSALAARIDWDRLRTAEEAVRRFGRRYEQERAEVERRLHDYLEELSALRRAGAPGPEVPWCDLSARQRRALLDRHGVRSRWTP